MSKKPSIFSWGRNTEVGLEISQWIVFAIWAVAMIAGLCKALATALAAHDLLQKSIHVIVGVGIVLGIIAGLIVVFFAVSYLIGLVLRALGIVKP